MSFRLDRFVTLHVADPIQRSSPRSRFSIPILMYHSISETDETGVRPYYRTTTTPSVFALHMKSLYDCGYCTVNLAHAVNLLQDSATTKRYTVITFDDGYADFYSHAFPELNRWGFTATVFLPTAYIGRVPTQFCGKDCLTWGQIRELRRCGISFGSHTVTHTRLSSLDAASMNSEIASSKQTIDDNLGESIDSFAYPFAFPEANTSFIRILRDTLVTSGYSNGVSTRIGTARPEDDCYFLRRLPINSSDDSRLFRVKLQGGYNWLHAVQRASKVLRAHDLRHS